MIGLFAILVPILLTDIVNPVLMGGVIFALGSKRPYLNSVMILLGWFIVYFVSGIILALGLDAILDFLNNPRPVDFYIETVVSLLLIWLAVKMIRKKGSARKEKKLDGVESVGPWSAFGLGASVNLIGMPFAIPYFAVIDQILKEDLTTTGALFVLFIYNFLYILPFAILIIIRKISGEKSAQLFSKINSWMEKGSAVIIPILFIVIALVLLSDAVYYFVTGLYLL